MGDCNFEEAIEEMSKKKTNEICIQKLMETQGWTREEAMRALKQEDTEKSG